MNNLSPNDDSFPRRGRPPGIPRDGVYGSGIKTVLKRIPVGSDDYVVWAINDLPELLRRRSESLKDTRDYVQLRRFLAELYESMPDLPLP
jgi:hypothetical protein